MKMSCESSHFLWRSSVFVNEALRWNTQQRRRKWRFSPSKNRYKAFDAFVISQFKLQPKAPCITALNSQEQLLPYEPPPSTYITSRLHSHVYDCVCHSSDDIYLTTPPLLTLKTQKWGAGETTFMFNKLPTNLARSSTLNRKCFLIWLFISGCFWQMNGWESNANA